MSRCQTYRRRSGLQISTTNKGRCWKLEVRIKGEFLQQSSCKRLYTSIEANAKIKSLSMRVNGFQSLESNDVMALHFGTQRLILTDRTTYLSKRRSSCVTARGVPPAEYSIPGERVTPTLVGGTPVLVGRRGTPSCRLGVTPPPERKWDQRPWGTPWKYLEPEAIGYAPTDTCENIAFHRASYAGSKYSIGEIINVKGWFTSATKEIDNEF